MAADGDRLLGTDDIRPCRRAPPGCSCAPGTMARRTDRDHQCIATSHLYRRLPQCARATGSAAGDRCRSCAGQCRRVRSACPVATATLLQLVHDLGPPAGTEWRAVRSSAVLLIRRLWREAHGLGDAQPAAWTLVTAAVHDRADEPHASGRDAIDGALNRPSMRALDACIALAVQQVRVGQPIPPAFLDLLDETLELDGPDGLHARAVIAQRLGWRHDAAPHWFASRQERLIGSAAPDDPGQQTWDLYIAWGSHSAHLLEAFPDRYLDALARQQQAALPRILTGMLWGVASWADVPQTVQRLADIDPQWVSRGAEELGHSLQTSHDPPSLPVNAGDTGRPPLPPPSHPGHFLGLAGTHR
jgi:hypothetical protein